MTDRFSKHKIGPIELKKCKVGQKLICTSLKMTRSVSCEKLKIWLARIVTTHDFSDSLENCDSFEIFDSIKIFDSLDSLEIFDSFDIFEGFDNLENFDSLEILDIWTFFLKVKSYLKGVIGEDL